MNNDLKLKQFILKWRKSRVHGSTINWNAIIAKIINLKPNLSCNKIIIKIDSRTRSFCLCQYVQNGLSYLGEETQPKLCLKWRQANSGVSSLGTNKHQLSHRIQSVWTFTNLQQNYKLLSIWNQSNKNYVPNQTSMPFYSFYNGTISLKTNFGAACLKRVRNLKNFPCATFWNTFSCSIFKQFFNLLAT